jgi:hypothetical protein
LNSYFTLKPGKDKFKGCYSLVTPVEPNVSRAVKSLGATFGEGSLTNIVDDPGSEQVEERWYQFICEDMDVVRYEYDLKNGHIGTSAPIAVSQQVLENHTSADQRCQIQISEKVTHTSSWERTEGVTVSKGMSLSRKWALSRTLSFLLQTGLKML